MNMIHGFDNLPHCADCNQNLLILYALFILFSIALLIAYNAFEYNCMYGKSHYKFGVMTINATGCRNPSLMRAPPSILPMRQLWLRSFRIDWVCNCQ